MPDPVEIRPVRRDDRAQLVELVNAHVGAVLPGVSLSTNAVLSQLERDPAEYGFIEVGADLTGGGTLPRLAGWAELDNLHVAQDARRRGVATWLLGHTADWLRLGAAHLLLAYAVENEDDAGQLPFLLDRRFRVLTRTRRGYERPAPDVQPSNPNSA